jgi:hypothetical protein
MSAPSNTLKEVEEALRLVIRNLIDGQEGFQKIGEELKDETLKRYFLAESLKRAQFRGDLETVLHQEGVHDIKESGSAAGAMLRAWADLKTSLAAAITPSSKPPSRVRTRQRKPTRMRSTGNCPSRYARSWPPRPPTSSPHTTT